MSFASIQNLIPSGPNVSVAQHGDDRGLHVEFYDEAVFMEFESTRTGRPVYSNVPYVHILLAGGKNDLKRPVKLEDDGGAPPDPHRWPRQWEAYKAKTAQVQAGMPIELWPGIMNKAQVFEFKAAHIHTVEQLAAVPDSMLHTLGMMGRNFRDKAQKYLADSSDGGAQVAELEARNKAQEADLAALKAQFAQFQQQAAALAAKPKRGRKPKPKENPNAEV